MSFKNIWKNKFYKDKNQQEQKNEVELVDEHKEELANQFDNEFESKKDVVNNEEKTTEQLLEEVHKAALVAEVKNNDETKNKIMQQAQKTIDQNIQEIDNKNNLKVQQAVYDTNKEACRCYGIEDSVPTWEVKMMAIGHAIWFVIYFIFASLTFCPINVFVKGIKSFVKNAWLAILFGVVCYLVLL